ncbi:MAG TPA: GNAT family N-acetyltransferase [Flavobacterium sp.]|nr:GNAT family N-acetyltransferase [Flavobacterium sp.]
MATYKKISHSDIDALVAMMAEFYAIDGYAIDVERSKKLFAQFIEEPNLGNGWLIESENETVGYVILTFVFNFEYGGKIAFVDELYLSENARGKGIGKETMAFILSESGKLDLKLLYLEVEDHNTNAKKLYLSSGFEFHNRLTMKYKFK